MIIEHVAPCRSMGHTSERLNPYSNGMIIELDCLAWKARWAEGLNPYSNGMIIERI